MVQSSPFFDSVNDLVLVMDGSVYWANGLWSEFFKFIAVGKDTADLGKLVQTPLRSLDLFQNCAFLSMMNSKPVTNWINYWRELWEHPNVDLIARLIFIAVIACLQCSSLRTSSCLLLINKQSD